MKFWLWNVLLFAVLQCELFPFTITFKLSGVLFIYFMHDQNTQIELLIIFDLSGFYIQHTTRFNEILVIQNYFNGIHCNLILFPQWSQLDCYVVFFVSCSYCYYSHLIVNILLHRVVTHLENLSCICLLMYILPAPPLYYLYNCKIVTNY